MSLISTCWAWDTLISSDNENRDEKNICRTVGHDTVRGFGIV